MQQQISLYPDHTSHKLGFETIREETLAHCNTPYGRERVSRLVPESSFSRIEYKHKLAAEWMELTDGGDSPPIYSVDDIRDILSDSRAIGSLLPLTAFLVVLKNARIARVLNSFFQRFESGFPNLKQITSGLHTMQSLEETIQRVVTDQGEMKDDASPELKRIRSRINRERNKVRKTIQQTMKRWSKEGKTSDEGPTIRNGRMVIPVQAEFKRKVDGFVHDVSSSGQTIYIEPVEALQINNEIRHLESEEKHEVERIIQDLTTEVRKHSRYLTENIEPIGRIDELNSIVHTGRLLEGHLAEPVQTDELNLIDAKNPILLLKNHQLPEKEKEDIVPLNLEMKSDERALIITGPNAGGKSVAMKTAGILTLMVQCGYPVPARSDSRIPVVSGLFVDIGDDQSIESDLSTFSSRLNWMKKTLERLEPNALVLIDEAAAGTDPDEGGALFQAFIEEVIRKKSRCLVTTHHGSLKIFAHNHSEVVNGAMEFDQDTLSPTYRFKKGVPGSSYAFEIAARMDVPDQLLQRARQLIGEKKDNMGELLIDLEKQVQEWEQKQARLNKDQQDLEKQKKEVTNRESSVKNKRDKILQKAYRDAEEIMKSANRRIEEAVERIASAGQKDDEEIKEARKEVEQTKKDLSLNSESLNKKIHKKPRKKSGEPGIGDFVIIGDSQTAGELIEKSGGRATVLVNGMKIKSDYHKLCKTDAPKKSKKKSLSRTYAGSQNIDLDVKPRLDLRGMRGDDAVKELNRHLDKATARGLHEIEIIHGKGEGILLELVHKELEKRDEVLDFDLAPWDHGGTGCTLAKLR